MPPIKLYYKLLSHYQNINNQAQACGKGGKVSFSILEPWVCISFTPLNKLFNLSRSKFSNLFNEDNGSYLTGLF